MDKSPDAFRTISEVADHLATPAHVLRFWESRFPQVRPVKRAGGRRYYRPSDVALLAGIRRLLHDDGLTIRGVQKILRDQGVRHVAAMSGAMVETLDDIDTDPIDAVAAEPLDAAHADPIVVPDGWHDRPNTPSAGAEPMIPVLGFGKPPAPGAALPATEPVRRAGLPGAGRRPDDLPLFPGYMESPPAAATDDTDVPNPISILQSDLRAVLEVPAAVDAMAAPDPLAQDAAARGAAPVADPAPDVGALTARLRALPAGALAPHRDAIVALTVRLAALHGPAAPGAQG